MIVIDLSQTLYASILAYDIKNPDKIDLNIFRHICLNALYNVIFKFKYTKYGQNVIIACDSKINWRKEIFPYYKYNRQKNRQNDNIDWSKIYDKFNILKTEIKNNFIHYKVIEIEGAEADDIIYTTVKYYRNEPIMIISGDKDLIQLQRYPNVQQYDSIRKIDKKNEDPIKFLEYQIFKGDSSDGIPNILSHENSYFMNKRCKPLFEKKITAWVENPLFNFNPIQVFGDEEIFRRYEMNKKLIDLTNLPNDLYEKITNELKQEWCERDNNKILKYFCDNKLNNLIQFIQNF